MNCFDHRTCIELLMQRQFLGFLFQGGLILILPLISLSAFLVLFWMEANLNDRSVYSRKASFALRLLFLLMFLLALLPALAYVMPSSAYWIMGIPDSISVFQLPAHALNAIGMLVFGATIIGGVAVILQFGALGGLSRLSRSARSTVGTTGKAPPPPPVQRTPRNLSVGELTPVPSASASANRGRKEPSFDIPQGGREVDAELTRPRPGAQPDIRTSIGIGSPPIQPRTPLPPRGNRDDLEVTLPPNFRMPDLAMTTSLDYIAWLELRYIGAQRYDGDDARWLLDGAVKIVGRKSTKGTQANLIPLPSADVSISREQMELRPDTKGYRVKNIGQAEIQVSDDHLLRDQETVLRNGEQVAILVGKRKVYTFVYSQLPSPQLRVVHVVDGSEEVRRTDDFRFTIGGPTPSAGPATPQPLANIYFDLALTPPGYVIEREKMQDSREYKQIVVNGQELLNQVLPLRHGSRISIGNHELILQIPETPHTGANGAPAQSN